MCQALDHPIDDGYRLIRARKLWRDRVLATCRTLERLHDLRQRLLHNIRVLVVRLQPPAKCEVCVCLHHHRRVARRGKARGTQGTPAGGTPPPCRHSGRTWLSSLSKFAGTGLAGPDLRGIARIRGGHNKVRRGAALSLLTSAAAVHPCLACSAFFTEPCTGLDIFPIGWGSEVLICPICLAGVVGGRLWLTGFPLCF
jgi:hypothetical protein